MFSHITLGSNDIDRAMRFYGPALGAVGLTLFARRQSPDRVLYHDASSSSGIALCVMRPFDGNPATVGNGVTVGIEAKNRGQVDAFHAAALANGGTDEGKPGLRSHYSPTYYGAYVRDPDGNKLCCVFDRPE